MHDAEQQFERERRIQECYGLDQKLLYQILEFPKSVYDKFIDFINTKQICNYDAENLARDIIYWEWRTQLTMKEFYSLQRDKSLIANMYIKTPEITESKEFQEFEDVIKKNIDEFQNRTRLIVSLSLYDEVLDEDRKHRLRDKYLNYLFDKYDNRRNRKTS